MTIDVDDLKSRLAKVLEGELEVGDVLGTGGFATVFRAHDPFLHRDVAVKVLDPSLALSSELEEQFLSEARIVAGVEHPHIVPLYKAESRDGLLYLVMRLVPGRSLADRIASEGPLPFAEAARIAHEVAQALAASHARGVVHRDVKPDNILLDAAGHAIVTDFGIAQVTARRGPETVGMSSGTPRYMSPEQLVGEAPDGRADVYSLGVVLFEMLTGHVPFEAPTMQGLTVQLMTQAPPSVSVLRRDTPAALAAVTDVALSKDPKARPDSAEMLRRLAAARTPDALLTPQAAKRKRWRRRFAFVGVGLCGAAAVIALGIWAIGRLIGLFSGGRDPQLSALGSDIPPALIAAARAEGSVRPGETVRYAFVPGGSSFDDAFLMTDSAIVRRSSRGYRRLPKQGSDVDLKRDAKTGSEHGYFIVRRSRAVSDTLYTDLSGVEVLRIATALSALDKKNGR